MATVLDIIKRAMRLNGTFGSGETLTPDESTDGLLALNSMMSLWATEGMMLFKFETVSYTPTAGSFTIGATGQAVTTRPVEILSAYRRTGTLDTPVEVVGRTVYEMLALKAQTGQVAVLYYKPTMPNGTVFIWPVNTTEVLYMTLQQPLTAFATTAEVISLPDGYEETLVFNLAVCYAPEFGIEASSTVQLRAANSKRLIKTVNSEIPQLEVDPTLSGHPARPWWSVY